MNRVKLDESLVSLNGVGLEGILREFSLNTKFMGRFFGRDQGLPFLERKDEEITAQIAKKLLKMVPAFDADNIISPTLKLITSCKKPKPCSMKLDGINELEFHTLFAYQVSAAHYVLASRLYQYKDRRFPENCCGTSGRNVALSLMMFGYLNAIYVYNSTHDHGYAVMPFVINPDIRGSLIVDPTSDQMWHRLDNPPRNSVFVEMRDSFEYRTHWKGRSSRLGPNLYPTRIMNINTIIRIAKFVTQHYRGLEGFKKHFNLDDKRFFYSNVPGYFKRAFSNPIRIKSTI